MKKIEILKNNLKDKEREIFLLKTFIQDFHEKNNNKIKMNDELSNRLKNIKIEKNNLDREFEIKLKNSR